MDEGAQITFIAGLRDKRAEYDKKNRWTSEELKQDQIEKLKLWAN